MKTPYGFVVSLTERTDRREAFETRAKIEKLDFEFVDAYKGDGTLSSNQFACSASHLKAISAFLSSEKDWSIIFEDDADLCERFIENATLQMEQTLLSGGNFCYLGGFGFATDDFTSQTWHEWKHRGKKIHNGLYQAIIVDGAHCYAINREAALKIITMGTAHLNFFQTAGFVPVVAPPLNLNNPAFDNLLNDMVLRGAIRASVAYPVLSNQTPGFSNIEKEDLVRPVLKKISY